MTDLAFYDDMDALATELLTDFGSLATLRKFETSKPNAEGKTQTTHLDVAGLAVQTSAKAVMNLLVKESSAVLVVKFPGTPAVDNHVYHGGNIWKVNETKLVNPQGNRLILAIIGVVKP